MWVPGLEPEFSGRAVNALSHGVISLAHEFFSSYVSMCGSVHMSAQGSQKKALDSLEPELQGIL